MSSINLLEVFDKQFFQHFTTQKFLIILTKIVRYNEDRKIKEVISFEI